MQQERFRSTVHRKKGDGRPRRAWLGLAVLVMALVAFGCGISLTSGEEGTEIFQDLRLTGEFMTGGSLQLVLSYEQPYPVDIGVECALFGADARTRRLATPTPTGTPDIRQRFRANKVTRLLYETIPANPDGGPVGEATPVPGTIEHGFTAPSVPGVYRVVCFTPADSHNAIKRTFVVHPAPTPTDTPTPLAALPTPRPE
jgi:hypothetical protein